ncbi:MAG: NAD(P)/FAD-dependent oxidoreductase [Acidimicrobiales bacterium]
MSRELRIVVIGGGIAGVSAAYWLANHPSRPEVTVLEAEGRLAAHTTGRSAAQFIANYGAEPTRPLSAASRAFLTAPPEGLTDHPLLARRGHLSVAGPGQEAALVTALAEGRTHDTPPADRQAHDTPPADHQGGVVALTPDEAVQRFPPLRTERVIGAVYEPGSADIDVAGLHQVFVRGATRAGARIALHQRVTALEADAGAGAWRITAVDPAGDHTVRRTDVVVNAAGAWGDMVAASAGVRPLGLTPRRRTAFMVTNPVPDGRDWPLVADIDHRWYLKPDGTQLLCSPADETPSEPCDARPEEVDVARAIEAINEATTLGLRTVRSAWAGLRTFTSDEAMAIGPDPDHPGFVWCVGQGGVGIQTAPAAGALTARSVLGPGDRPGGGHPSDPDLSGVDVARLSPARFRD